MKEVKGDRLSNLLLSLPSSIDVTEVQIFIIIMYLLAAVGGSAFWQSLVSVASTTSSNKCARRLLPLANRGLLVSVIPDSRLKYPDEDGSCHLYFFRCHLLLH